MHERSYYILKTVWESVLDFLGNETNSRFSGFYVVTSVRSGHNRVENPLALGQINILNVVLQSTITVLRQGPPNSHICTAKVCLESPASCRVKDRFSQGPLQPGPLQPKTASAKDRFSQRPLQPETASARDRFSQDRFSQTASARTASARPLQPRTASAKDRFSQRRFQPITGSARGGFSYLSSQPLTVLTQHRLGQGPFNRFQVFFNLSRGFYCPLSISVACHRYRG
jgi:hypothetical protein